MDCFRFESAERDFEDLWREPPKEAGTLENFLWGKQGQANALRSRVDTRRREWHLLAWRWRSRISQLTMVHRVRMRSTLPAGRGSMRNRGRLPQSTAEYFRALC